MIDDPQLCLGFPGGKGGGGEGTLQTAAIQRENSERDAIRALPPDDDSSPPRGKIPCFVDVLRSLPSFSAS